MNQKLWNKHIEDNLFVDCPVVNEDKSNIKDFYVADVVGNRKFAQNFGGHPRSDIAEINSQASLATAENLLRDLQVFEPTNDNAGLNDAEILLGLKSRYQQTPSEMVEFCESQIQIRDAKRAEAARQQNKEGTIDFSETEIPSES